MMEDPASMTTEAETEAEASVLASTAVDTKVIFCTSRTFACSVSEFSFSQKPTYSYGWMKRHPY